jgi:hypothetical protein
VNEGIDGKFDSGSHEVLGVYGSFGTNGHIFGSEKNYIQSVEKLESNKNSPAKHNSQLSAVDNNIDLGLDPD